MHWLVTKKSVHHQKRSPGPILTAKIGPPCQIRLYLFIFFKYFVEASNNNTFVYCAAADLHSLVNNNTMTQ